MISNFSIILLNPYVNVSFGTPLKLDIGDRSIVSNDIDTLNFWGLYRGIYTHNGEK